MKVDLHAVMWARLAQHAHDHETLLSVNPMLPLNDREQGALERELAFEAWLELVANGEGVAQ